jgi:hypothetical protein
MQGILTESCVEETWKQGSDILIFSLEKWREMEEKIYTPFKTHICPHDLTWISDLAIFLKICGHCACSKICFLTKHLLFLHLFFHFLTVLSQLPVSSNLALLSAITVL